MNTDFHVGDKVIRDYRSGHSTLIGTIINITEKRGDITVDYGNFKEKYSSNGWIRRSSDTWNTSYIEVLTPELEEEIFEKNTIRKCRDAFEKKKNMTYEQAVQILKILEAEEL